MRERNREIEELWADNRKFREALNQENSELRADIALLTDETFP